MNTHTFLHRHFVAAPLLPVVLGLSMVLGLSQSPLASIYSSPGYDVPGSAPDVLTHVSGVHMILDPESQVELATTVPELIDGAMRMTGKGIVALTAGTADLIGLQGGFHVVKRGEDTITVSSLTTPVLIRSGKHYVLVPLGKQWRGDPSQLSELTSGIRAWDDARTPQVLPDTFLQDEISMLVGIQAEFPHGFPAARSRLPLSPAHTEALRFAAADKRAETKWKQDVLGHLRFFVEQGDNEAVQALLRDERVASGFEPSSELAFSAAFLLSLTSDPTIAVSLLPLLHSDDYAMTVAAAHPALRTAVWMNPPALSKDDELMLTRLLGLLSSDTAPQSVAGFAVERFQIQLQDYLALKKEPLPMLNFLGGKIAAHIQLMETKEYPERARRYAAVLVALTKGSEDKLSPELKNALDHALAIDTVQIGEMDLAEEEHLAAPVAAPAFSEKPATVEKFIPEEVQRRAKVMLKQAGALITIKTTITPVSASVAHVDFIVFPTPSGDRMFAFDLNMASAQVENIVHDGQQLPFPMPLENFVSWLRTAKD